MANVLDDNKLSAGIYNVDDSVVPDSDPIEVQRTAEFLRLSRQGVIWQPVDPSS